MVLCVVVGIATSLSLLFLLDMPGSIQSALCALLDAVKVEDYVRVVREVALVGGCNCSRASLVGACLGAKFGLEGIPLDWMEKTEMACKALSLAIQLVKI